MDGDFRGRHFNRFRGRLGAALRPREAGYARWTMEQALGGTQIPRRRVLLWGDYAALDLPGPKRLSGFQVTAHRDELGVWHAEVMSF